MAAWRLLWLVTACATCAGALAQRPEALDPLGINVVGRPMAFCSRYDDNTVAADAEFKGKVVAVLGKVERVSRDVFGNAYAIFDGGGDTFTAVQCYFRNEKSLAHVKAGLVYGVCGRCKGKVLFSVLVDDCEFLTAAQYDAAVLWLDGPPRKAEPSSAKGRQKAKVRRPREPRAAEPDTPERRELRAAAMLRNTNRLKGSRRSLWLQKVVDDFPETKAGRTAARILQGEAAER